MDSEFKVAGLIHTNSDLEYWPLTKTKSHPIQDILCWMQLFLPRTKLQNRFQAYSCGNQLEFFEHEANATDFVCGVTYSGSLDHI